MKPTKFVLPLLVASLAGNAAFLAFFLSRSQDKKSAPMPVVAGVALNEFNLEQQAKIEVIMRHFRIRTLMAKQDILGKRVAILEEIGKIDCRADRVRERIQELNQIENQLNSDFADTLLEISDLLTPSQRLALITQLGRNWFFLRAFTEKRRIP